MAAYLTCLPLYLAAGLDCPLAISIHAPPRWLELLEALGVSADRLLFVDPGKVSIFPRLYVSSWPRQSPQFVMHGFLDAFAPLRRADAPKGPPLYLTRAEIDHRPLLNEPEVRDLFVRRGFRAIGPETMGVDELADAFANPACVAGPFGSAFFNLAFSSGQPPCLLILPPYGRRTRERMASWIAAWNVSFAALSGEFADPASVDAAVDDEREISVANKRPWVVDLGKVDRALDRVVAKLGL
jgi:capsular polysaccharide biosynthesis protein